ncbi:hypothetical protein CIB95_09580 [Lottiidibacillus patelloidae]|uniref:Uncharacterized protein n=1 Tax=Lottiidibacillus patelloidae TaxID=2670334 RepID=A0A263BTG8_9BACI|nr:hypothetical protein CIB95_09580 [Lottiidibacillus patelloidae]
MTNCSNVSHGQFLSYIYICRAIFHDGIAQGIRMSFFSNFIWKIER